MGQMSVFDEEKGICSQNNINIKLANWLSSIPASVNTVFN